MRSRARAAPPPRSGSRGTSPARAGRRRSRSRAIAGTPSYGRHVTRSPATSRVEAERGVLVVQRVVVARREQRPHVQARRAAAGELRPAQHDARRARRDDELARDRACRRAGATPSAATARTANAASRVAPSGWTHVAAVACDDSANRPAARLDVDLDVGDEHHAAVGRLRRDEQQRVVAARADAVGGAHREAAEPVGLEPLASGVARRRRPAGPWMLRMPLARRSRTPRDALDQVRGERGPPGLVARAEAAPVVAVEVLVEQHEVLEARIARRSARLAPWHGRRPCASGRNSVHEPPLELRRRPRARFIRLPDPVGHSICERVAVEVVVALERLDQQVVRPGTTPARASSSCRRTSRCRTRPGA